MDFDSETLQELKDKKLKFEELNWQYFVNSSLRKSYYYVETKNIQAMLNEKICSFKQIVDRFKKADELQNLLNSEELFEELMKSNQIRKEDLRYLAYEINDADAFDLESLCQNIKLIKLILENLILLDEKLLNKLNTLVDEEDSGYYEDVCNVHNIFEVIEYHNKNKEEILKLTKLHKYIFKFEENQRATLIETLKNSEAAKNTIMRVVDNHLEANYDFDSLMNYLKKNEKKNVLNI